MAKVCIHGEENMPPQPSLYLPCRLDKETLEVLVKAMGGPGSVTYLMERHLKPEPPLLRYVQGTGRVLEFDFRNCDSRDLREQILAQLQQGRDVVFIPGIPNRDLACLSDVPMPFMMHLAALHITPVPVFVGFYRKGYVRVVTEEARYDTAVVDVLPKLEPGPLAGDRVLEAWMEASARHYAALPQLKVSLARLLVEGMRKHAGVRLEDGLDDTGIEYGKLLGVAMALARWMRDNIHEPRVGVLLPPGKGGVIANFACILAGVVPVNINYTSSEGAFESICRQSGIKSFITARPFMAKLPQFPWPPAEQIIYIERVLKGLGMAKIATWVAFAKLAPMPLVNKTFHLDARSGADEAALLFTSGSSGEPKGVSMTHTMLVGQILQMYCKVEMGKDAAVLASLPIFHSFGLSVSTLMPAIFGIKMVTYPSPLDAKRLNELIEKHRCRLVVTTPTFARSMLRRATAETYKSVHYFVVGAEKLQESLADEFREKCGVKLMEGYGLTEASPVVACCLEETGPTPEQPFYVQAYRRGSVGQLLPGQAVRITDPDDDSVRLPLSQQGMLWVKGANIFNGYIGREELNREILKDGWFKTGDLGSVDLNGMLSLGGRRSRFSKIGGEMVPHEVVEQAVEGFVTPPQGFTGRAVAVVGVPDPQKGEALVLLSAVHHTQLSNELDAIREHLVASGMPRLWCPREIIPVEAIPVLPTGKMDLKGCHILAFEALGLPV
ncbi:MAG: AMP-binding protein [Akkermansia sp.]|nr:AMP-binding protein [Akkermansia sp.]